MACLGRFLLGPVACAVRRGADAMTSQKQGEEQVFISFLPGMSVDAMKRIRAEIRIWRLHRQTPSTIEALAKQYNRVIQG